MNNREKYAVDISTGKSYCIYCKDYLPIENFAKTKNSSSGYYWACKNCRKHMFKRWYKENSEANIEHVLEYRKQNIERALFQGAKARAKRHNLEFNITLEDITPFPTHCPILGIPLFVTKQGTGSKQRNSFSIDRIDNAKGYIKGNVIVVSRRANLYKSDMNLAIMKRLYEFYKPYLEAPSE